jgi:hypothetical protein
MAAANIQGIGEDGQPVVFFDITLGGKLCVHCLFLQSLFSFAMKYWISEKYVLFDIYIERGCERVCVFEYSYWE